MANKRISDLTTVPSLDVSLAVVEIEQSGGSYKTQMDSLGYLDPDGSVPMLADLPFQTALGANEMKLDYQSLLFAAGITFAIAPVTAIGDEGLVIKDDGKVGIGTTTPLTELDVKGRIHSSEVSNNWAVSFLPLGATSYSGLFCDGGGHAELTLRNFAGSTLIHLSADASESTYLNSGDVGVGTSSPSEKLDVVGNIQLTGEVILKDEVWHVVGDVDEPAYQGDWVESSTQLQSRFMKFPDGSVELNLNAIDSVTPSPSTTVFSLPAGYLPTQTLSISATNSIDLEPVMVTIDKTTGNVQVVWKGTYNPTTMSTSIVIRYFGDN